MWAPKLRELKEAITALIVGPYTSPFPAAPPDISESFRGTPRFSEEDCVGCGACANVCPPAAIEMTDDAEAAKRVLSIHLDQCIYCGQCEANCLTEKGVAQTLEYDLTTTDRSSLRENVEKELLLCEGCGAIIGARDHVLWVAEHVGPLVYSNPTLLLAAMQEQGLADKAPEATGELRRGDRLRILCPKCRQVTSMVV